MAIYIKAVFIWPCMYGYVYRLYVYGHVYGCVSMAL